MAVECPVASSTNDKCCCCIIQPLLKSNENSGKCWLAQYGPLMCLDIVECMVTHAWLHQCLRLALGTNVDYWPVTAKQGEVHHPSCSNANPNHNTNPNRNPNPNPNPNPTADPT